MTTDTWSLHNPVKIRFGAGRLEELPSFVSGSTLIVTSEGTTRRGLTSRVAALLNDVHVYEGVQPNPAIPDIEAAIVAWRDEGVTTVVGLGGGSAIDMAKILSLALATPDLTLAGWMESAAPWETITPLPAIAIPTTAGTGSEVTPFCTIWDPRAKRKHSVGTPLLHPAVAIVDPELALTLPWDVTLSTGLDAFSQCLEAICHREAAPVAFAIAEHGLGMVPSALVRLRDDPTSLEARSAMAEAAVCSGLAISTTRTGLAHSMSYPLTAHLGMPHGLACGLMLIGVLDFNVPADDGRLDRAARIIAAGGSNDLVQSVLDLYDQLQVWSEIDRYLPEPRRLHGLAAEMLNPDRSGNNMRHATFDDVHAIVDSTVEWLDRSGAMA